MTYISTENNRKNVKILILIVVKNDIYQYRK